MFVVRPSKPTCISLNFLPENWSWSVPRTLQGVIRVNSIKSLKGQVLLSSLSLTLDVNLCFVVVQFCVKLKAKIRNKCDAMKYTVSQKKNIPRHL